jgi:hypothetical protein
MKNQIRLGPAAVLTTIILFATPPSSFGQSAKVKLNDGAFAYARELVEQGHVIFDKKSDWNDYRPTAKEENEFSRIHGIAEYAKWYLGIDEAHAEGTKARYKFPFGDFKNVHRSGLLAVKSRAHQFGYSDIENAAGRLLEMIDSRKRE